jgi:hypothetical protein
MENFGRKEMRDMKRQQMRLGEVEIAERALA